jgi:predicted HicB family RNase H-like nuclease
MPSKLQAVRIYLPPEQVAQLNAAAAEQGISIAELVRRLLIQERIISDPLLEWGGKRYK